MKSNKMRMSALRARFRAGAPKFRIGQEIGYVTGIVGVIDTIYADLDAAMDCFIVPQNWYEIQNRKPKTPKTGYWYGVILPEGAVLAGEDDIVAIQ